MVASALRNAPLLAATQPTKRPFLADFTLKQTPLCGRVFQPPWWLSWGRGGGFRGVAAAGGGGCRGVVYGVVVAEKARGVAAAVSGRHGGRTYRRDKDGTPFYPGFGQPEQLWGSASQPSQHTEGPSEPVQDDSPVEEVAAVKPKRKYTRSVGI
ncbi:hypothetical protein Tco_0580822 [Tanacetum coccineum]